MKKLHTYLSLVGFVVFFAFSTAKSQDCFYVTAASLNASNGSRVCVDISVHDFVDISSFQFSLVWDPVILKYFNVQNVNLPSPGGAQFGTPLVDSGVLTFFWLDAQQGHTLSDRSQIFSVCFDVIGTSGELSDVDFSSVATNIEVYDSNLNSIEFHSIAGVVAVDGNPVQLIQLDTCETNPDCTSNLNLIIEGGADPLSFNWTGPNSYVSANEDLTDVASGIYSVTVTDANGVSTSASYEVGKTIPAISGAQITDVKCFGFNNGKVSIDITGGVPPYDYAWSNSSTFEDLTSLAPGDYTVTVTDQNGCTATGTYTVNGNDPIELVTIDVDCENNGNDGFVTIEVTGGSGNYSFDWSFGPSTTTGVYGGLAAGSYDVSVTDEFNCPYIIIPFGISAGIISTEDAAICSGENTQLVVDAPKGETFTWSPTDFLSCSDCPSPVANPNIDIQYYVTVIDSSGCSDTDSLMVMVTEGCVWPGDCDISKEVNHCDLLNIGLGAGKTGPQRMGASTGWMAQEAMDWNSRTPVSNIDFKHSDTNGDGTVNAADTMAIAANWGEMHNLTGSNGAGQKFGSDQTVLSVVSGGPIFSIDAPDTLLGNQTVSLPIILGSSTGIISKVYGLAFSIDYDPARIEAGSVAVQLTNSWLGVLGNGLIMMQRNDPAAGRIDVAITAMDGNNRSGFGQMALLNLTLKAISGSAMTTLGISNAKLITNIEENIAVSLVDEPVTIVDMISGLGTSPSLEQSLQIFPNPAKDILYLQTGSTPIERVEMFDITGGRVNWLSASADYQTIRLPSGLSGTYVLRVYTSEGMVTRRIVVVE